MQRTCVLQRAGRYLGTRLQGIAAGSAQPELHLPKAHRHHAEAPCDHAPLTDAAQVWDHQNWKKKER